MAEDLPALFAKFREGLLPDIDRIVRVHTDTLRHDMAENNRSLKGEMLSHFDDVYKRFDRLSEISLPTNPQPTAVPPSPRCPRPRGIAD